jgi:hypothetical protein
LKSVFRKLVGGLPEDKEFRAKLLMAAYYLWNLRVRLMGCSEVAKVFGTPRLLQVPHPDTNEFHVDASDERQTE